MKQSEQALYITLIDFLIQIIFIGLVVGVVYAVSQTEDDKSKNNANKLEVIAKDSGMNVEELLDYMSKLGPIKTLGPAESAPGLFKLGKELENLVAKVGGVDEAKNILKKSGGQGYESCLPDKKAIVTFHAYENYITVDGKTKEFDTLLSQLGVSANKIDKMTFSEFKENFNRVIKDNPNCRYNVNIIEHSDFKKPRDVIRTCFWPKSYKNAE
ncbi:MAG: hypothetical protein Q7U10_11305 [Thermodesulfovibrionia bacterium]|nr:hypothetical protein [Thermodesulfovibrionia bacterium]